MGFDLPEEDLLTFSRIARRNEDRRRGSATPAPPRPRPGTARMAEATCGETDSGPAARSRPRPAPPSLITTKLTCPSPLTASCAGQRAERAGVAHEDAQRLLDLACHILQRLHGLDAQIDAFRPVLGRNRDTTDLPGSSWSRYCASPSENSTASYWPDTSENCTTPILLPVRVLRSCLEVTVPASRPAVAPRFTAAENSAQFCTRIFCSARLVLVERMRREVEADHLEFAMQPVGRQPRLGCGQIAASAAGSPSDARTCRCWPERGILAAPATQAPSCARRRPSSRRGRGRSSRARRP